MRARARFIAAALVLVGTLVASASVAAQTGSDRTAPPDEDRFVNARLPSAVITTSRGEQTDLARVANGRPLLLALVFTRCAGVCSPFLMSWRDADRWIDSRAGVHRLVLSFDPRDSPADMAALARHLGLGDDPGWTFGVASPDEVRRLADTAGFWYSWDDTAQQYDHPAMLAAVRDGRLVRLLVGGSVASGRLDELVREARGEFVPSYPLPGRVRFRCIQYDPRTGRASLDWGFSLLLLPMGTIAIATSLIFAAGARRRVATGG